MLAWARLSAPALRRRRGPAGKEMPCRAPPSPASLLRRRGLAGLPDEAPLRPPGVRFLGGLQAARLKLCLHSLLLGVQGDEITALVVDDPPEIVPDVAPLLLVFLPAPPLEELHHPPLVQLLQVVFARVGCPASSSRFRSRACRRDRIPSRRCRRFRQRL